MTDLRAMTQRDIIALSRVVQEEAEERQRQMELAAKKGGRRR